MAEILKIIIKTKKIIILTITTTIKNNNSFLQEEVTDLLLEAMGKHPESKGFLIDGFPANIDQAKT